VRRLAALGVRVVTFGGGDPFAFSHVGDLLFLARQLGLFVHVDTNGIGLWKDPSKESLVETAIDLLGLPLDGHAAELHDAMRGTPGHFGVVTTCLARLARFKRKLKINTLVSSRNLYMVPEIARVVASLEPARWSLYQFWPLGGRAASALADSITNDQFLEAAARLGGQTDLMGTAVEAVPAGERRLAYPLVAHDGSVYVHAAAPASGFAPIGSVFDDAAVEQAFALCRSGRSEFASRYVRGVRSP